MRSDITRYSTYLVAGAVCAFGAQTYGEPVIGSPLDVVGSTELTTVLDLDMDAYENLRHVHKLVMTDFALGMDLDVNLNLTALDPFADDARLVVNHDGVEVEVERPDVVIFDGIVDGNADSWAYLAMSPFGTNGVVELDGTTYVISSGPHGQGEPTQIYNLTDLPEGAIEWYEWVCRADELDMPDKGLSIDNSGGFDARGLPCRNIEAAIETDTEYLSSLFGGNQAAANAYTATLVGAVSSIYSSQMNIQFEIVFTRLWAGSDPYSQGNTIDQLFEFIDEWEANMGGTPRDLAHFFSGRGLGGGVAYLSAVCESGFNYALSANLNGSFPMPVQHNSSQNWDLMVTAHEWGHNVGAPHTHDQSPQIDNCAGGNCSITPNATIMSYCHQCPGGLSNVRMEFHNQTINSYILPYMNTVGCDMTCPSPGIIFSFPSGIPNIVSPNGSTTIEVHVLADGETPQPGTGMFHYDDGGGYQAVAMTQGSPNEYTATVPALPCDSTVDFYFSAQDTNSATYTDPSNAPTSAHSATVADGFATAFADDFETNMGWSVSGNATDGQWERGTPVDGGRDDPPTDGDGSGQCYVTDNVAGNSDVDGGTTTLTSPVIDASGGGNFSYLYWYNDSVNPGGPGDGMFVDVSTNGGSTWTNIRSYTSGAATWRSDSISIGSEVAASANFRIRFSVSDVNQGDVIEGGLDGIDFSSIVCNTCTADWNGDGNVNTNDFIAYLNDYNAVVGGGTPTFGDPDLAAPFGVVNTADFIAFLNAYNAGC